MTGETQPTRPLPDPGVQWVLASPPEPRRRRRAWPWIVALAVMLALAVAAWFIVDAIARDLVTKAIREQAVSRLALPPDHAVDVTVDGGAVIPQLISGSLDAVTVSSDDVTMGTLTGDVAVTAHGVPISGDAPAEAASATVGIDEEQLRTLLATVEGFPADTLTLAQPNVDMTFDLGVFGASFPVGVGLAPSAVEGDIVLTPARLDLAGAQLSADDLRARFGIIADAVLRDWTVCIAQYIPVGVTLTDIAVEGELVVADLDIDGGIISDPALQAVGTCE
ncbi:MAG TPA: DUF2993 domain-containing protein [Microbacterium sp.]|uniref:LmeA family phospholipid-binding protein n=1 Tax=Microbacterium sp. TaxID=51671 RepID=UPI002CE113A6|nr:DUF2993 domain-containing protein [Microbacterium sp.]HWI31130.1 DUF2993 domain-containing protein [Microbacterium sp.]